MTSEQPESDRHQPLIEHLIELRNRLMRMVGAVAVIFVCLFSFSNQIYTFVSKPLQDLLPENSSMIATNVASPFMAPFKLTLVVCVLVAMPYILYQIWAFISPGLYQKERRIALPLFCSSVLLFYGGMAFAYFLVFPILFDFFTSASPTNVQVMTDINSYLDFVLGMFFAFGAAFQIPIAVILLCWSGVTNARSLAAKRPYIVVGCFVVSMLLTPPDVISQTLLALPMWALFEAGVFFGRLISEKEEEKPHLS